MGVRLGAGVMMLLDVNVLMAAHRVELPDHVVVKRWLEGVINDGRAFGAVDGVLCGFVRIATQAFWKPPTQVGEAMDFVGIIRGAPGYRVVQSSERQWEQFERVCRDGRLVGKAVQDAYWGSFALDLGCDWITFDRDFARIPGLRWRSPLDARARTNPR